MKVGTIKTKVKSVTTHSVTGPVTDQLKPAPEQHGDPVRSLRPSFISSSDELASTTSVVGPHNQSSCGSECAQASAAMQRKVGNARLARMISGPQSKIPVSESGDRYEEKEIPVQREQGTRAVAREGLNSRILGIRAQPEEKSRMAKSEKGGVPGPSFKLPAYYSRKIHDSDPLPNELKEKLFHPDGSDHDNRLI